MTAPETDQPDEPAGIEPPPPGVAMLACACGAVLDSADMHRSRGQHPGGPPIARITCCDCSGGGGRRAR